MPGADPDPTPPLWSVLVLRHPRVPVLTTESGNDTQEANSDQESERAEREAREGCDLAEEECHRQRQGRGKGQALKETCSGMDGPEEERAGSERDEEDGDESARSGIHGGCIGRNARNLNSVPGQFPGCRSEEPAASSPVGSEGLWGRMSAISSASRRVFSSSRETSQER